MRGGRKGGACWIVLFTIAICHWKKIRGKKRKEEKFQGGGVLWKKSRGKGRVEGGHLSSENIGGVKKPKKKKNLETRKGRVIK